MSADGEDRRIDAAWTELIAPGAAYEVTTVEVRGQTLRTFVQAPRSMTEIWMATSAFADRSYLVFGDERITYGEAHEAVASVASWMAQHGVVPGDRVAIAMRNYPEWMLAYWACLSIGATAVGMNAWWVAEELAFALDDAAPRIVVCDAERHDRLVDWLRRNPGTAIVLVRADARPATTPWSEVAACTAIIPTHDPDPDDDACIFYTSGTTGTPKGARLTHRGCINTVLGIGFVTDLTRRSALAEGELPAEAPVPIALVTTPLFHVTANNALANPVTAAGGTLVLMHRWDAGEALRLIETERVTVMSGVPTMTRELLAHPDAPRRDLSSIVTLSGGGAPVPPDLVARVAEDAAPMQPSTGFGMTETCGLVSGISGDAYLRRPTSCGRPIPTFEVEIRDDDGRAVPPGIVGELCVKGAGVIKGYLNRADATAETIVDGWLRTGDIAYVDPQGYIFIVDRKKDMVLRGGENVYCAEVEAALYRHPAVAEACVFGVPDERLGEAVAAAVLLQGAVSIEELQAHAASLIAAFKVPRHVWIVDAPLPRNASGKFLRRDLRDALTEAMTSSTVPTLENIP